DEGPVRDTQAVTVGIAIEKDVAGDRLAVKSDEEVPPEAVPDEALRPWQRWPRSRRTEVVAQFLADAQRAADAGIGRDIAEGSVHPRHDVEFQFGVVEQDVPAEAPTPLEGEPERGFVVELVGPAHGRGVVDQTMEVVLDELAAGRRTDQPDVELQGIHAHG